MNTKPRYEYVTRHIPEVLYVEQMKVDVEMRTIGFVRIALDVTDEGVFLVYRKWHKDR